MKIEEAVKLHKALGVCGVPGQIKNLMQTFPDCAAAWDGWPVERASNLYWLLFRTAGKYGSKSHRFACRVLGECLGLGLQCLTNPKTEARASVNRVLRLLARYGAGEAIDRDEFYRASWAASAVAWAARAASWAAAGAAGGAAAGAAWEAAGAARAAAAGAAGDEGQKQLAVAIRSRVSAAYIERRMRATVTREGRA